MQQGLHDRRSRRLTGHRDQRWRGRHTADRGRGGRQERSRGGSAVAAGRTAVTAERTEPPGYGERWHGGLVGSPGGCQRRSQPPPGPGVTGTVTAHESAPVITAPGTAASLLKEILRPPRTGTVSARAGRPGTRFHRWRRTGVSAVAVAVALTGSLAPAARAVEPAALESAATVAARSAPAARPPVSARALVAEPGAFLREVDFASSASAVAEWSNCSFVQETTDSARCRYAYTATTDGWRTSRVLPFFDRADADGGDERFTIALDNAAVLSVNSICGPYSEVGKDNVAHRVRISEQPLRLTGPRTFVGELPGICDPGRARQAYLYDPATRALHPMTTGRASEIGSLTRTGGRVDAVRLFGTSTCRVSSTTDGGRTWRDRDLLDCRGPYRSNDLAEIVVIGAHLVVLTPAAPHGRGLEGPGRFWVTLGNPVTGPLRTVRESWGNLVTFDVARVGRAVIVTAVDRRGEQTGWRVLNPITGALGPVHHLQRRFDQLDTDGTDTAWIVRDHHVIVYAGRLDRPRVVNPR